ncbi:DUF2147 domain-containing protein [Roseibium denhamense]|uniref:DUF2147 domain-containing protein n=1 Tax=Roseibium denhamense TaxID=76305 RepID=UPI001AD92763|nr:DUF2147 domain-containing protein [Roseibium denhamense]
MIRYISRSPLSKRSVFLCFLAALMGLTVPAAAAPDIAGEWKTPAGATIQVAPCGKTPCGTLVRFPPPPGKTMETTLDENNRDSSKRGRKVLGLKVLWRLQPDGNAWSGRVYDPRRGISANAKVRLKSPAQLEIKGCVRVVFNVCETEIWTRLK